MASDPTVTQRLLWFVNAIWHQILAIIVVYIIWTIAQHYDGNSTFTWHVVLSSLGFIFFMMEGVFIYIDENIYAIGLSRITKITVHIVMMSLGVLSLTLGISLMIKRKGSSQHFTTTHGALGLASWIFAIISAILGIMAKYTPMFKVYIRPVWIKLMHVLLGLTTIILGLITLGYGLDKAAFKSFSTPDTVVAVTVLIAIVAFWSFFDAFKSISNYVVAMRE